MAIVSEVDYFARLIEALEPWLDRVVIIGGWAHRLYRLCPLAQPLDYEPLWTLTPMLPFPLICTRPAIRSASGHKKTAFAPECKDPHGAIWGNGPRQRSNVDRSEPDPSVFRPPDGLPKREAPESDPVWKEPIGVPNALGN